MFMVPIPVPKHKQNSSPQKVKSSCTFLQKQTSESVVFSTSGVKWELFPVAESTYRPAADRQRSDGSTGERGEIIQRTREECCTKAHPESEKTNWNQLFQINLFPENMPCLIYQEAIFTDGELKSTLKFPFSFIWWWQRERWSPLCRSFTPSKLKSSPPPPHSCSPSGS